MKNRKLAVLPIAVLSLGALVGCNKGNDNVIQKTIEQEIDEALTIPEDIHGISNLEAKSLVTNVKGNFNSLNLVNSKIFNKNSYSKVYTGSYSKLLKDNEITYDIESKHYDDLKATITTKKSDTEIENGHENKYEASRVDTVYYEHKDGEYHAYDNIQTYQPSSFGDDPLIGQEDLYDRISTVTSETEAITKFYTYLLDHEKVKMGNDNNMTDLGYFFKDNSNNAYCIKLSESTKQIKNTLDLTKRIKVTTKERTVMRFTYDNGRWYSKSFAKSTETYFDRDLNDNVFASPVLVEVNKYCSSASYGARFTNSPTIVTPDQKYGTSVVKAYLDNGTVMDPIEDKRNNYTLRDVSTYTRKAYGDDYVFTVIGGEQEIGPAVNKVASSNATTGATASGESYEKYNPLSFVNELHNDSYITQKNSDLAYTTAYLSQNRTYDFTNIKISEGDEFKFDTAEGSHIIPDNWSFDATTGKLSKKAGVTENISGQYYVTLRIPFESNEYQFDKVKLSISLAKSGDDTSKEATYYSATINGADQNYIPVVKTKYHDGTEDPDDKNLEAGYTGTLKLLNDDDYCTQQVALKPISGKYIKQSNIASINGTTYKSNYLEGYIELDVPTGPSYSITLNSIGDANNLVLVIFRWTGSNESSRPIINGVKVDKDIDGENYVYFELDKTVKNQWVHVNIQNTSKQDQSCVLWNVYDGSTQKKGNDKKGRYNNAFYWGYDNGTGDELNKYITSGTGGKPSYVYISVEISHW